MYIFQSEPCILISGSRIRCVFVPNNPSLESNRRNSTPGTLLGGVYLTNGLLLATSKAAVGFRHLPETLKGAALFYAFLIVVVVSALTYVIYIILKEIQNTHKEKTKEIWDSDSGWKSEEDIHDVFNGKDDH